DRPTDLAGLSFELYVDGMFFAQTEGTFDGTIYIPDVPDGPFVLKTSRATEQPHWEQREAHDFVVVAPRVGRPDAVLATSAPLHLQLDNLAPWSSDDWLVADCFENGTEHYPLTLDARLAVGATQVDASFDWADAAWGPYLLDGAAGDRVTISHYVNDPRTDLDVTRLTQVATGSAPSQTDGAPSDFAAAFVDVAATLSLTVHVDLAALAAAVPQTNPNWGVTLLKGPGSHDLDWFGPQLVSIGAVNPPMDGQVVAATTYGDPFNRDWPLLVVAGYGAFELLRAPDGSGYSARHYAYDSRVYDGSEYTLEIQEPVTSGTLNDYPLIGDIPWDGKSPVTLQIDVPPGRNGFSALLNLAQSNRGLIRSDRNEITLPSEAVRMGVDYFLDVHVSTETETSSSGVFSTLGPFRLVPP
ncbi:MAG TPA: hypothetical protein VFV99_15570, partial [Kofleriaceae bacterium]|nr:hypothetical protein [Kofleriaceae bacterium]